MREYSYSLLKYPCPTWQISLPGDIPETVPCCWTGHTLLGCALEGGRTRLLISLNRQSTTLSLQDRRRGVMWWIALSIWTWLLSTDLSSLSGLASGVVQTFIFSLSLDSSSLLSLSSLYYIKSLFIILYNHFITK